MKYDWIIGIYSPGEDKTKKVLQLAEHGIGYYILNRDRLKVDNVKIAFRRPHSDNLPEHLHLATEDQIIKLELLKDRYAGR